MSSDHCIPQVETHSAALVRGFALVVGPLVLAISIGCGGGSSSVNGGGGRGPVAASIASRIAVGTAPSAVAIDSTNNKIYVTDFGTAPPQGTHGDCTPSGSDIKLIDGSTQAVTTFEFTFFVPPDTWTPYAAAVNPASNTLYAVAALFGRNFSGICSFASDGIELFDTTTLTQTRNIGSLLSVGGVDVNLTTGNLYATLYAFNTLAVVGVVGIPVGTNPLGVAVNANTNMIYVANSGSNNISVVDGTSNSVVATVADPNALVPVAVAVNPTTNTIYVANQQSNNLTVIDGTTNSVTATIPVGTSPSGVAAESRTNFIYVSNFGNSQNGDPGNITVINGATKDTTTLTDAKAVNPAAIGANSVTNKIYVANWNSNNVTVIDGAHD